MSGDSGAEVAVSDLCGYSKRFFIPQRTSLEVYRKGGGKVDVFVNQVLENPERGLAADLWFYGGRKNSITWDRIPNVCRR